MKIAVELPLSDSNLNNLLFAVYAIGIENGSSKRLTDPAEINHRREAFIKSNPGFKEAKELLVKDREERLRIRASGKKHLTEEDLMLSLGFHKHKQSYRGKGKYYSVGGYDLTKDQAKLIHKVFNEKIDEAREPLVRILDKADYWKCIECKEYYHDEDMVFCEVCDNNNEESGMHEWCAGYMYAGYGEYPDESAYALCKEHSKKVKR